MRHTFFCIDGHTCGNPVRLVAGGGPRLHGQTMSDKRQDFVQRFDWIRTGLMYEPRGHAMMSGAILYPPTRADCDIAVLYIETTGCLPMCGHGTIGTVTFALEHGLVQAGTPGTLRLDTPAGLVEAHYREDGGFIDRVKLVNVPAFLHSTELPVDVPGLGELVVDVAYGGNFYAIIEPQTRFADLAEVSVQDLLRWSPGLRRAMNERYSFVHPQDPTIQGLSHVLWTGRPSQSGADGRNAVFYGDSAIDRSPCGTGTSARMAQRHAKGLLREGERFVHESIIGSLFTGKIEAVTELAGQPAIIPSIEGWARLTGLNTLFIDDRDPYKHGFVVS
ncbi:MAG: 4-hydroxyproline epimerase [Geminicoccaceae bacterium]